ncbi:MAG: HAD family phosphatase [Verrucomicrobiota bacterium]
MIEAILFDIGNVLLNFDYRRAVRALTARSTVSPHEVAEVLDVLHGPHETGQLGMLPYFIEVAKRTGYRDSEEIFHQAFSDIFTPNEPMWEFVRPLFGKIPVYLFSNVSERHEKWIFENYSELSRFDGGFYSWRMGCMKPDPEYYRKALRALPYAPERIAYVDDLRPNVLAGEAFGMQAIRYLSDDHPAFLREVEARGLLS